MLRIQAANTVMMIRPAAFGFNPDTASSNAMQQPSNMGQAATQTQASIEFAALSEALLVAGVNVCVVQDTHQPPKPDAIFPNNWVSFHHDGTVVLYPLQAPSRRVERRREIIEDVAERAGFRVSKLIDLTEHEERGEFLEGTGSLVLDHAWRVAYACRSPRTSEALVERWCSLMGYEPMLFDAVDASGRPYYHTNVVLGIGSRHAVIGLESVAERDRAALMNSLQRTDREIVEVDRAAVANFACNILELTSRPVKNPTLTNRSLTNEQKPTESHAVLAMSASANRALGESGLSRLAGKSDVIVAVPIPTIERVGGGSARCMLAEVFTPS